jgi:hypothetical protein
MAGRRVCTGWVNHQQAQGDFVPLSETRVFAGGTGSASLEIDTVLLSTTTPFGPAAPAVGTPPYFAAGIKFD